VSIVVTGGAGFIGSNLLGVLNDRGRDDLVVVDELDHPGKVDNLAAASIRDYLDKDVFRRLVAERSPRLDDIEVIVHQGACTTTDEPDVRALMDTNHAYSVELLELCLERSIPLVYASSAAVYGRGAPMVEAPAHEHALNAYAYSKLLFDQRVRRELPGATSPIVGLRYFNVYGPREAHKGRMASLVTQIDRELAAGRPAVLFGASHGFGPGGHRRDFVHVDDVTSVIAWFLDHPETSGIFNCGTGESCTFQELAESVIRHRGAGMVDYRPMPAALEPTYQPETRADLGALRAAGCDVAFRSLDVGVKDTLTWTAARRAP
jgi:ADP-L-glycero-D-manno-heptose 6-epimerase